MAGMPGRSGGKRTGAGRKPAPKPPAAKLAPPAVMAAAGEKDMLRLLQEIALGLTEANSIQVRAAIAAVQYTHTKLHDGGKKEAQAGAAKKAAVGRFKPAAPPKLIVNNR